MKRLWCVAPLFLAAVLIYASMMMNRIACSMRDPTGRGWASSRPVRTFEDALIFVIDMSRCIDAPSKFDQTMLARLVKQDYTQPEAAELLGISHRTLTCKFPATLDRLTVKLLDAGIMMTSSAQDAA